MLASLIIVFREVFEAGLIVGVVLAATVGIPGRTLWISGAGAIGVLGAGMVALFARALASALSGVGQEVFTAGILLCAVLMLGWHNIWMARHGREMAARMQAMGRAVKTGERTLGALGAVIAVAILREGSEVVLFLTGVKATSHESGGAMLAGGLVGVALGCLLAWLLYRGLVAIPVKHMFKVINWLLTLLAAGMAGQAAALLASVDILPSWGAQIWNSSALLAESSLAGQALHALIGYADRPPGIQIAAYLATLLAMASASHIVGRGGAGRRPLTRAGQAVSVLALLGAAMLLAGPALAQDELHLTIRDHHYQPEQIEAPSGVKFKLLVKNEDENTEEFESDELKREKLVPPGEEIPVFLGPLDPGSYDFFGDFHRDTAHGTLVVK